MTPHAFWLIGSPGLSNHLKTCTDKSAKLQDLAVDMREKSSQDGSLRAPVSFWHKVQKVSEVYPLPDEHAGNHKEGLAAHVEFSFRLSISCLVVLRIS